MRELEVQDYIHMILQHAGYVTAGEVLRLKGEIVDARTMDSAAQDILATIKNELQRRLK